MRNKVAVITGGSSGIGESLAYKFSQEGFNILIILLENNTLENPIT